MLVLLLALVKPTLGREFLKGGENIGRLVLLSFFVPVIIERLVIWNFIYYILLKFSKSQVRILLTKGKTGYGLKLALKINKHIAAKIAQKEREEDMKGVRFDKPHFYRCKCDEKLPETEQTKFLVRFTTAKEQADLRDMMYSVKGFGDKRNERFLSGTIALEALRIGLKGWENFNYEDGSAILYNEDNFSCIPPIERDEIASYIRGIPEGEE